MYSSRIGVQDYVPCAACCWTLYVYTCEWSLDAEMLLSWIPKTYWSAYLQDYLTATDQCVVLSHQHQQNSTNSQQHLYSLLTSSFYLSGAIFIYFIFSQNYIQTSVDMHWKNMSRFLAHLSWKLKWAFLITRRPSSVYLSVCKLFTFSSSPPEPLGQFQPNLAQSILGWRGFKFIQMKGPALFQGEIITK